MKKLWADRAWDDYLYWQTQDKKTLKRINELIKSIETYTKTFFQTWNKTPYMRD